MGSDCADCKATTHSRNCNDAQKQKIPMVRIYLTLALSIMMFKGAQTMYNTTINNYLFQWIYDNGKETNFTVLKVADNDSTIPSMCFPNLTVKLDKDIAQKKADKYQTNLLAVASTVSLVTLMVYGCLSDYLGRKMIFIACLSGYIIQLCIACIILNFYAHVNFLYIAYIVDGLGGSAYGFSLGCFLSLTDIAKTKNEKILGIALIDSLIGIGGITTKFSTKLYLKSTSYNYPILTACGLCIILLIIAIFLLKDTLYISQEMQPQQSKSHSNKRRFGPKELFKSLSSFYIGKRDTRSKLFFWLCFVSFCLVESPSIFRSDLIPLIQMSFPLCWSRFKVDLYTFCALGLTYVIGMMLMKPLQVYAVACSCSYLNQLYAEWLQKQQGQGNKTTVLYVGRMWIHFIYMVHSVKGFGGSLFAGLLASELVCEVVSEIVYKFYYAHHGGRVERELFLSLGAILVPCLFILLLIRLKFRSVMDGQLTTDPVTLSVNYKVMDDNNS